MELYTQRFDAFFLFYLDICCLYRSNFAISGTNILLGSGSGHTAQQIFFKFCPELSRSMTVIIFFNRVKALSRLLTVTKLVMVHDLDTAVTILTNLSRSMTVTRP